jgi:hypothetical protein
MVELPAAGAEILSKSMALARDMVFRYFFCRPATSPKAPCQTPQLVTARHAPASALHPAPIGVVDDAIQDGVGQRRISDDLVPAVDRQLAGANSAGTAVP